MKLKILIIQIFLLIGIQINGQINICEDYQSYHPIDEQIISFRDSLNEIGIDTVLIYRHWKYTNGFNGYGKVIWAKNGKFYQFKSIFENEANKYGIKSLGIQKVKKDSLICFYFQNRLDTITENPTQSMISMSHDASHFVEITIKDFSYCFVIKGLVVSFNPVNLRAKWINMLADEKDAAASLRIDNNPEKVKGQKRKKKRKWKRRLKN